MNRNGWLGIGMVVSVMVASAVLTAPGIAAELSPLSVPSGSPPSSGLASSVAATPHYLNVQPKWSTGNLCEASELGSLSYRGHGDITCTSVISNAKVPLWWNFSEVPTGTEHGTVTVAISGSGDCINLNFNSSYTTIVIVLYGSSYSCPQPNGVSGPGVNIVVNSNMDSFALEQDGNGYATSVASYGTTTYANDVMSGLDESTTVTYIGWSAATQTCPAGVTAGQVVWSEVAFGSYDTFNTIFVDEKGISHAPPNHPYSTKPLGPPEGLAYGHDDLYGSETTQSAPAGSCYYLGV